MNSQHNPHTASLNTKFLALKKEYAYEPYPSLNDRLQTLKKLRKVLLSYNQAVIEAINHDFGNRASEEILLTEFMPVINHIDFVYKRLPDWMRSKQKKVPFTLKFGKAFITYQPLGVIGIIAPWNYPFQLSLIPAIDALAAGNRVFIKVSELTPQFSKLIARIIATNFPETLLTIMTGDKEIGIQFSKLPFDHLVFTGSTQAGYSVMANAAQNLTPVTLELGGKSPVIIADEKFSLAKAAKSICIGKSLNAGQTCIAPDYLLLKSNLTEQFIKLYKDAFNTMYSNSKDYTYIINNQHFKRLETLLEDAQSKGATITKIVDINNNESTRQFWPVLVTNLTPDMLLLQEEVFGPILPIVEIENVDDALRFIAKRKEHPLALYYFGSNKKMINKVLQHSHSGSVCINDTMVQILINELHFGGVGHSGMGGYRSKKGFITFSNEKPVFKRGFFAFSFLVHPPYIGFLKKRIIRFLALKKLKTPR